MEIIRETKCKASIKFKIAVNAKLWIKWKGRKDIRGWRSRRWSFRNTRGVWYGDVIFYCSDLACVGNMTPERIADIEAILLLLKEV
jgi:hypothetical protein